MAKIWIIHRDERLRAALARLAGSGDAALLGAPDDPTFLESELPGSEPPRVVVLGLAGDLEAELQFAHQHAARARDARWLLLCPADERPEVERLFAPLPAEVVAFPPTAAELRGRIRTALLARQAEGLAERRVRDAVATRFARWFADLELPELMRALDPKLADVPFLVRGEPGTGRSLAARYVHAFGGGAEGAWVEVSCAGTPRAAELAAALRSAAAEEPGAAARVTVCLRDADRLPPPAQQTVCSWVELGLPAGAGPIPRVRWMATVADDGAGVLTERLDPALAQALAGLSVRLPPLRERTEAVEALAGDAALAWCRARGERPRTLAPDAVRALQEHLWPGNLRELEAVVARSLAGEAADPLRAGDLHFDPESGPSPGGARLGEELAPADAAPLAAAPEPAAALPEKVPAVDAPAHGDLRHLVRSLAHEVRNPLVAIRTFAALLPERAEDPAFREQAARVVGHDVGRIERILDRLAEFAELDPAAAGPVDVATLLEEKLEGLRDEIESRRLLVLKEVDRARPLAHGDAASLGLAFELLLDKALAWMPDRADVYVASRHQPGGLRGGPSVRVMLRFYRPGAPAKPRDEADAALSEGQTSLEVALAELLVQNQGGTLALDSTEAEETLIVVDLPSWGPGRG